MDKPEQHLRPPPSPFLVGTRASKLAVLQTESVLERLGRWFPAWRFEVARITALGDRDLQTDLRLSPPDFFTRELDARLLAGELDFAVHSAKDLPDPMPAGIDWFWLPWREDPRDVLVCPAGRGLAALPPQPRIGVSSGRREEYCRRRFPDARQLSIRGTIEQRLAQLDRGDYDLLVMAGAALQRLGLQARIAAWIPPEELPPPEGQGALAITFRAGDARWLRLRRLFVKTVTFAAAGVGSAGACTLDSLAALQRCDICLHDTLLGHELMARLPPTVRCVDVGKRCGQHSVPQDDITQRIARHARQGVRVVRLKGGDPGIFGRLAEEIELLDALQLPYRVLPGVSSLTAATTTTGMLLTRRGVSRGFTVMTPRKEGGGVGSVRADERAKLPLVFYMAVSTAGEVARQLLADGLAPRTPAAVVYSAGSDQTRVLRADLDQIAARIAEDACEMPGLLLVGETVGHRYHDWGALEGRRVLLTASEALQERAAALVSDAGGVPVCRPLIRLVTSDEGLDRVRRIETYDWVVLTSPSAVRCFGELLRRAGADLRRVPRLVSCGAGTSRELCALGLRADLEPADEFSAAGLLEALRPRLAPGERVLRLRSDKAGPTVAAALQACGAAVDDCVLYRNEPIRHEERPEFDAVFFASASAVEVFAQQWGVEALRGKFVLAIGQPTLAALRQHGVTADLVPPAATVESGIEALALHFVIGQ
jgi:uroporphyrinogen III methyltransferase/synthase